MSLAEKDQSPSPSPTRHPSDKEKKKTNNDGGTKSEEPKGGLGPYFVSI
jgi:hypothetical protein